MPRHSKGASPLVAGATYIGIGLATAALIIAGLTSVGQQAQDTTAINDMIETMPTLEQAIRSVSSAGEGTRRELQFQFSRGELRTYPGDDTIEYVIDTTSEIISPQSSRQIGNVRVSAGADVDVNVTTIDGTDCWQLENRHVSACIAKIDEGPDRALVGYWPFDNTTGQAVHDNGRYGNDGRLGATSDSDSSDPDRSSGCRLQGCLDFDGDDDYVNATDLGTNGSLTVMAWFRLDSAPGSGLTNAIVVSDIGGSTQHGFQLHFNDGALEGTVRDGSGTSTVTSPTFTASDAGTWRHVALTINASSDETALYLDGEQVSTDSTADHHRNADRPTIIGAYHGPPSQQFDGQIDEVAVYNRSMTDTEIEARYETLVHDQDFLRTSDLLVRYRNTDRGNELTGPEISARINGAARSSYGFGHTEVHTIGEGLPFGRVTAHVRPLTPINYELQLNLVSGADFIDATVRPD